jgi:hypothetical protein
VQSDDSPGAWSGSEFSGWFVDAVNGLAVAGCNALILGVEFFLLFSHQIQALLFPFLLFFSLSLDLFQKL